MSGNFYQGQKKIWHEDKVAKPNPCFFFLFSVTTMAIGVQDLWEVVSGNETAAPKNAEALRHWRIEEGKVMCVLMTTFEKELLTLREQLGTR